MEYIYIGKIVNTHGIKGEIRILSNFEKKDLVFKPGFALYIGTNLDKEIIDTYRVHKNYDMVRLKGINNINEVLKYKGMKVYGKRSDLALNGTYLLDDLIGMQVICDNECFGEVINIFDNNNNTLLEIKYQKNYYIPYKSNYIKKIDLEKKEIIVSDIKDLIL